MAKKQYVKDVAERGVLCASGLDLGLEWSIKTLEGVYVGFVNDGEQVLNTGPQISLDRCRGQLRGLIQAIASD